MTKLSSFRDFNQACLEQGVCLHEDIVNAVNSGMTNDDTITGEGLHFVPYPQYVAVAESGRLLRRDPDVCLSTGTLDVSQFETDDFGLQTLTSLINQSHSRTPLASDESYYVCDQVDAIDTCDKTERRFAGTLSHMIKQIPSRQYGYQIVPGEEGPIFVRKSYGRSSTLSLTEVTVNGVSYPAGSLFRVELTDDAERLHSRPIGGLVAPDIPNHVREVVSHETVAKIAFMRLSLFALDPENRSEYGISRDDWTPGEKECGNLPIGVLRDEIAQSLRLQQG